MYLLRNRQKPLPNGITLRDPGTGFQSPAYSSFDVQVSGIQKARIGNPAMCKRYRLATDTPSIEAFVDSGLAQIAFENGWTDFYIGGPGGAASETPFTIQRPLRRGARKEAAILVEGGSILVHWLAKAEDAVPQEQSESRASVCVRCPRNDKGDWLSFFTRPLAGAFRVALENRLKMKLSTSHDASLHICNACACVLKLKVHVPFEKFWDKMDDEDKINLWDESKENRCWILNEKESQKAS